MVDQRAILVCSCEDTMPLDAQALQHGCGSGRLVTGRQFWRAELKSFRELIASGAPVTMGLHAGSAAVSREIKAPAR